MKKIVLTFGLLAGAILAAMMFLTFQFQDHIGFDNGEVIGYTSMVVAFLLTFFGVRSYRDNVAGGTVRFGRAFLVGALISVVASACYVAAWQVISRKMAPDFVEKYQAHLIEKARADGATDAAIAQKREELAKFAELYKNPVINAAVTFLEPLPVALIVTLVSAGVLSRRRTPAPGGAGATVRA
jgi:hypothetical protein